MPQSRSSASSQNGSSANGGSNNVSRRRPREDDDTQGPPCTQCRTRKVKCDRQQPDCSNCRRGGVACEYSSSTSRVYQVKELLDAFSTVTSRLDRIESTLATLVDQLKRPGATGLQSPSTSNGSREIVEVSRPSIAEANVDDQNQNQDHVPDHDTEETELTETYPAALSLFRSLHRRLERAVNSNPSDPTDQRDLWTYAAEHPGSRQILRGQLDKFPFAGGCFDFPITSDGQRVIAPPRWAVEDCVDTYLEHINSVTPIFDKTDLQDGIAFYYDSPPCQQVCAQALTYSNVLLLAKTLDFYVERNRPREPDQVAAELEQTRALIRNCDRALEGLVEFALVCQQYYAAPVYSRVLSSVTGVIRAMGLHQTTLSLSTSWEDLSEAERLFWIAYAMDKQNVFLLGQAGELYLFDCRFPLHPVNCEHPSPRQHFGALTHLMAIWEDIYLKLYSPRSTMCNTDSRASQAQTLRRDLAKWEAAHKQLLSPDRNLVDHSHTPNLNLNLHSSTTELTYALHVTELLISRCDPSLPMCSRYRAPSFAALTTITSYAPNTPTSHTHSSMATLSRIFRNYPMVPFHDLFVSLLTSSKTKQIFTETAEMLQATRRVLSLLQTDHWLESYYIKLYNGFSWCTEQVEILYTFLAYFSDQGACPDLEDFVGSGSGMSLGDLLIAHEAERVDGHFERAPDVDADAAEGARIGRIVGLGDSFFDVAGGIF
ncbi:hypothetical protein BJX62DRAFT_237630 [Aspergillus germanicus]